MTITDEGAALERLYADFEAAHPTPLCTRREGLARRTTLVSGDAPVRG